MPVSNAVLNQGLNVLKTRFKYAGLINPEGEELSGGTPAYTRQAITWNGASGESIVLSSDVIFDVPIGSVVAGWQIYDNANGGVAFGIMPLIPETHSSQDTYTLLAQLTDISVSSN